jgi:hypothetical protein
MPQEATRADLLLQHRDDPTQNLRLLQCRQLALVALNIISDSIIHHRRHLLDLSVKSKIFALEREQVRSQWRYGDPGGWRLTSSFFRDLFRFPALPIASILASKALFRAEEA